MAAQSEGSNARELSAKIDVDVSDALTGLKAVQREAKKATQALRELEAETAEYILTKEQAESLAQSKGDVYNFTIQVPKGEPDSHEIARRISEVIKRNRERR